jgi:hypothetical protein
VDPEPVPRGRQRLPPRLASCARVWSTNGGTRSAPYPRYSALYFSAALRVHRSGHGEVCRPRTSLRPTGVAETTCVSRPMAMSSSPAVWLLAEPRCVTLCNCCLSGVVHSLGGELKPSMVVVSTVMVAPTLTVEVNVSDVFLRMEGSDGVVGFLQGLQGPVLNPVSVLQALITRFSRDVIYTYAGPVLLAMNPYALVADDHGAPIYDATVMYRYRRYWHAPPCSLTPPLRWLLLAGGAAAAAYLVRA